jgi:hypothetical protein
MEFIIIDKEFIIYIIKYCIPDVPCILVPNNALLVYWQKLFNIFPFYFYLANILITYIIFTFVDFDTFIPTLPELMLAHRRLSASVSTKEQQQRDGHASIRMSIFSRRRRRRNRRKRSSSADSQQQAISEGATASRLLRKFLIKQ